MTLPALYEVIRLRKALNRIQEVLLPADDADHVETVGRAREIALATLNDEAFEPITAITSG